MTTSITTRAFCKRNLTSTDLSPVTEPWATPAPIPPFRTKDEYRAWCASPATDSVFFTMAEGENPALPAGGANKPVKVHGFIADYDAPNMTWEEIAVGIARANPSYRPFAWNRTFSGGARVVWRFEEPVFIYKKDLFRAFIRRVIKEVKAERMFPGLDDTSAQPARFFTGGDNWKLSEGSPVIPAAALHLWVSEATKEDDFDGHGVVIPLDKVAAEVERRFPGRWQGDFALGARGVRFWDATADALSAIVRDTGVQCFSGPSPFMTWEAIFGRQFVQDFLTDKLGAAIRDLYFDGKSYYRQLPDEQWDAMGVDAARRHLCSTFGLSSRVGRGENVSEADLVLHRVEMTKRIAGAMPFPHNPQRVVRFNGVDFLNTSNTKLWPAALDPQEWGVNFPWIADYLSGLFVNEETLKHFIGWLHVWLKSCHEGEPRKGHAMFLVGPPGTGKTLLSTQVVARMVGGFTEATQYIVEGNRFNEAMFEKCLLTIDDAIPGTNPGAHARFSAMIKAVVANGTFRYEKKFGKALDAAFDGRLMVSLNEDPNSLAIIPDTDSSLLDKIILLRTGSRPAPVAYDTATRIKTIEGELSYFVRYVLDYAVPEEDREPRFGLKPYHDAALLEDAQGTTASSSVIEAVDIWKYEYARIHSTRTNWMGTATELLGLLRDCPQTSSAVMGLNSRWLGRLLAQAAANGLAGISRRSTTRGKRQRQIILQLPTQQEVTEHDNERNAA